MLNLFNLSKSFHAPAASQRAAAGSAGQGAQARAYRLAPARSPGVLAAQPSLRGSPPSSTQPARPGYGRSDGLTIVAAHNRAAKLCFDGGPATVVTFRSKMSTKASTAACTAASAASGRLEPQSWSGGGP